MTLEGNPTPLAVVAAALGRDDGCWLLQRRPLGKQHGGLWEFPGGKVEAGETETAALAREVLEELQVTVAPGDLTYVASARSDGQMGLRPIVLSLYTARVWHGLPVAEAGATIDWYRTDQLLALALPPLDRTLARALIASIA